MSQLKISLLGTLRVELDGEAISDSIRTRKESSILAYLAEENGRSHNKSALAKLFWPTRPDNIAVINLEQAIRGIQTAISSETNQVNPIQLSVDSVQMDTDAFILDTHIFRNNIHSVKNHPHTNFHTCQDCIQKLEQSVDLYRGGFLEGSSLSDLPAFQDWIDQSRTRYHLQMLDSLQLLSKIFVKQNHFDLAYKYARHYVFLAPLDEGGHRLLMRILALSGRRNAAIQQYQFLQNTLERELGGEPSAETKQLYARIKNGLPIDDIDTGSLAKTNIPTQPVTLSTSDSSIQLYDPATSLPLKPIFMDRLVHTIRRMERQQLMAAVVIISISYPLNLEMPPMIKKQVQHHIAGRLSGSIRESDTLAVLQDDEYGLILEEIKDSQVLPQLAQKITRALNTPIIIQNQRIEIKAVLGTSLFPSDGTEPSALLAQAEAALKNARLHQASFYFPPSN